MPIHTLKFPEIILTKVRNPLPCSCSRFIPPFQNQHNVRVRLCKSKFDYSDGRCSEKLVRMTLYYSHLLSPAYLQNKEGAQHALKTVLRASADYLIFIKDGARSSFYVTADPAKEISSIEKSFYQKLLSAYCWDCAFRNLVGYSFSSCCRSWSGHSSITSKQNSRKVQAV